MTDPSRTYPELIEEISVLKQRIKELEQSESDRKKAEEALRESGERYQTLVENATDIVFWTDENGYFTFVNPAALRITGYEEGEIIGKHYKMFIRPDMFKEAITSFANQLIKKIQNTYSEYPILTKEGHEVWFGQNTQLIMEEDHVTGFQAVARDITDRKQAEEILKESEEKYRGIFENAVMGIFRTTPGGCYLSANPAGARMYGYKSQEEMIQSVTDMAHQIYVHPEDRKRFKELIEGSGFVEGFEAEHYTKDGNKIWASMNARVIRDSSDTILYYETTSENITERKQAEGVIKNRERLFTLTLDDMITFVAILKPDGEIIFVNNTPLKLIGKSIEQVRGMKFYDMDWWAYSNDIQQLIKEDLERCASGEKIFREVQIRTLDRYMWIDFSVHPIFGEDGNILYLIPEGRDTTERKQAEEFLCQAEQKYRSIFENAVEGIFQTSPGGQYISVNPALAGMIGYDSPEELIKGVTDLSKQGYVNPEDRLSFKKILEEQGIIQGFETQHYKKDGSIFWVLINARTVKDETGKIRYYEGTIEDITSRKQAEEDLKQTLEKLRKSLAGTIKAMSLTVETRDPYTAGHQRKVSSLARTIAQEMGLPNDTVDTIRMAGIIHDIGKISVPAEILSKPGILPNIEMSLIKAHSQTGYDILKDVGLPYPIAEIVFQHHERLDGSGYPQGLKDDQILLEARIISVADVVEAISSHRPYRPGFGIDVALEEIEKNAGILYDREAVEACLKLFREKEFKFK